MRIILSWIPTLCLCALLLCGCVAPLPPMVTPEAAPLSTTEAVALLTFVQGSVVIESGGTSSPATPFAEINEGSRVVAEANGQATIVCSNNHVLELFGPSEVIVTAASCESGSALPGNAGGRITPVNGQIRVNNGSFDLEEDAREQESDYGNLPIILRPRNSLLLSHEPLIAWVEVDGALEYLLTLSGPSAFTAIEVKADSLACSAEPRSAPGRVCTFDWPKEQWKLQAGKRYFLTISVRIEIAGALRESEKSSIRTVAEDDAAQLQSESAALEMLQLDAVTTDLLLAGLYAEAGLVDEAISRYERVVAVQPTAFLYNTLGDSYRAIDLQRYAFRAYQQALNLVAQGADDPAAEAAAEFGMGQIERSRMNFAAAEQHFVKAVELYAEIGAKEELDFAQKALDETRQHL